MDRGLAFLDGPFLLPRTIRSTSHSCATATVGLDPEMAVSYFLEALDSSEKEVAGQIVEALSVDANDGVEEGKDRDGKERRQGLGLGRKRPRFSMLPNKRSRESSGMNLTLNADHIVDPDEYFAAIERNDLAEKELKKLRGDVTAEPVLDNILRSRRQRRPGLLRRTSLNHFSQELADSAKALPLSREVDANRNLSLPKSAVHIKYNSSLMETTGSQFPAATELESFVAAKENGTDIIIDKLSSSCEALYDQEDAALLQECLKFKPMVVDKLQLPITPPDTPPYTQSKTSVQRKPLATISFLQKQNLQKDTLTDPYTWLPDDAPLFLEPLSSLRNGVAVARFPAINMNDWCAPPSKSGSKCSVDKILKSQSTLNTSINDSITPSMKKTSKLYPGGTLVSSNTEGGDDISCEISVDECPTDTSLTSILKSAKDKKNLPVETSTQMLTSFSSDVLASDSLTGALAQFSELSTVDSSAREPLSATEYEAMNANQCHASTEQPTLPVTSMNGTLAPFRKNISMPSSNGLKSSRTSSSRDDNPSPPGNSTKRLSLGTILKSQTIKECDKPTGNTSYCSIAESMENSGRSVHGSGAGSVGKQSLSNEKDNEKRFEVSQNMDAYPQNDKDKRFEVVTQNRDAHPLNDKDNSFEVVTQNMDAQPHNDNDKRFEVVTQTMDAHPQNDNDKRFEAVTQNMDAHPQNDNDKSFEVVTQNMEAHLQNDNDKRFEVVTQNMDAHPQSVDEALHEENERTEFSEDPLRLNMGADATVDGHVESSSIMGEHNVNPTTSRVPNERAPQQSKRRKSRGKSLAGDGTKWEAGRRRSTRERFRPLEHWRGERLLYGRIHQSLATVIGVKYSSPGESNLKVKSFVPADYTELVERAALH